MKRPLLIEISDNYIFDGNAGEELAYCTIGDLDGDVLKMIDSDAIRQYEPVGTDEFINKFKQIYGTV